MPLSVSLPQILRAHRDQVHGELRVCLPARVLAFDATAGTVDVELVLSEPGIDPDTGATVYDKHPALPAVPVCWPRGGGYVMTWPLAVGDAVTLVFSDLSMSEWLESGQPSDPTDLRRHDLGSPHAFPGAFPDTAPLASADASARATGVVIGKEGTDAQIRIDASGITLGAGATDFAALASKVDSALAAIRTWANTHTHPAPGGATSVPTAPLSALNATAATLVKAK